MTQKALFCSSDKWVRLACDEHEVGTHSYQIKHKVSELSKITCDYCHDHRKRVIIAKAMERYALCSNFRDRLTLWTVGTSLVDSVYNRTVIERYWKLLGSRLRTYSKRSYNIELDPIDVYNPKVRIHSSVKKGLSVKYYYHVIPSKLGILMNALEKGTVGGKLHYHFISRSYIDHLPLKYMWRDITGERSNVNFKARVRVFQRTAIKAFAYLAKYSAKDGLRYYFMGDMLKAKVEKYVPLDTCKKWYNNLFEDGWGTLHQSVLVDFG